MTHLRWLTDMPMVSEHHDLRALRINRVRMLIISVLTLCALALPAFTPLGGVSRVFLIALAVAAAILFSIGISTGPIRRWVRGYKKSLQSPYCYRVKGDG